MNVVVCGKVIPASSVTIEIDANTKRIVRKGVTHELDPAAASAVEEALRLTEKHGGAVTLITMGISDATIGIRNALAMGATSAVHILDDALAGSDTLATAKVLAAAIKKQEFDLVLCATESSDSYSGIVPGQIAYFLGVPPVTFAKEIAVDGNKITIKRQSESGYDVVEANLPALVACSSGINEPRYPQLKGIMAAKKKRSKFILRPISACRRIRSAIRARGKKCSRSVGRRSAKPAKRSLTKAKAASRSRTFLLKLR